MSIKGPGPCAAVANIPPRLAALLRTPPSQRRTRPHQFQSQLSAGALLFFIPLVKLNTSVFVIFLGPCSAGGTGVLLNIERVAAQLQQLGAEAQVRGLVDSGWFLESKQPRSPNCPEGVSCSPEDAIKLGLRYQGDHGVLRGRNCLIVLTTCGCLFFISGCGTGLCLTDADSSTRKERSGSASLDTGCIPP